MLDKLRNIYENKIHLFEIAVLRARIESKQHSLFIQIVGRYRFNAAFPIFRNVVRCNLRALQTLYH